MQVDEPAHRVADNDLASCGKRTRDCQPEGLSVADLRTSDIEIETGTEKLVILRLRFATHTVEVVTADPETTASTFDGWSLDIEGHRKSGRTVTGNVRQLSITS